MAPILIWLATLAVMVVGRRSGRGLLLLAALAVVALGSSVHWGRLHGDGRFVHDHELFHYTMGSRYWDELGHDGLYAATHVALEEAAPETGALIAAVKNLRTYALEPAATSRARGEEIRRRFTSERWERFSEDVGLFASRIPPTGWMVILADHGYNATPFWTALGGTLAGISSPTPTTLRLLALLDPMLLVASLWFVGRTLGARPALLATIFLLANPLATFDIVGGAFLRQLWLAATLVFVAAYHRGWGVVAGVALGVATLDRIFPGALLLVPLAEAAVRRGGRCPLRVVGGFLITVTGLGLGAAALTGGVDGWADFVRNILAHDRWFYFNQVAFRNVLEIDPRAILALDAAGWTEGAWLRERLTRSDAVQGTLLATRVALLGLVVVAMLAALRGGSRGSESREVTADREGHRRSPRGVGDALGLAAFLPFVLAYPADYYHALLVVVLLAWPFRSRLPIWIGVLALVTWTSMAILPRLTQLEATYWTLSVGLTAALVHAAVAAIRRSPPPWPRPLALTLVLLPLAGVLVDGVRARRVPDEVDLDLLPRDVVEADRVRVVRETMLTRGGAWSRNDHVVLVADPEGGTVSIELPRLRPGRYRGLVDVTASPGYGLLRLDLGPAPGVEIDLQAPVAHPRTVSVPPIDVGADPLVVTATLAPSPSGRERSHAALDRIRLWPEETLTPEAALARAVDWMRANPADLYDGGLAGIADELWTWHVLARAPGYFHADPESIQRAMDRALAELGTMRAPASSLDPRAMARVRWVAIAYDLTPPISGEVPDDRSTPGVDGELVTGALGAAFGAGAALSLADVAPAVARITAEIDWDTRAGRRPPESPSLEDRQHWRRWHAAAVDWTLEHGNAATLARLVTSARDLGLPCPRRTEVVSRLLELQSPEGTFGTSIEDGPNLHRGPVLAGIRALHILTEATRAARPDGPAPPRDLASPGGSPGTGPASVVSSGRGGSRW